jgi:hypothetical protein
MHTLPNPQPRLAADESGSAAISSSATGRSDSQPQAIPSRTETEAHSGFLALDHTSFPGRAKDIGVPI